ncbi:hypothetical protein [Tepidibacter thalassicus]|uniref:Uncharacterized protein n=1 Tax=Tepidibacter thalassicus DSM 15285 TaxID=1123350 RepID=A0A1M5S882_9FIRM|nr:hypothetical protein [Tepidibacter thalassicus]SHH34689.1 hypothetical protein SAMN02744040_01659 [Tepidibacter thalassicus DSM 15285]
MLILKDDKSTIIREIELDPVFIAHESKVIKYLCYAVKRLRPMAIYCSVLIDKDTQEPFLIKNAEIISWSLKIQQADPKTDEPIKKPVEFLIGITYHAVNTARKYIQKHNVTLAHMEEFLEEFDLIRYQAFVKAVNNAILRHLRYTNTYERYSHSKKHYILKKYKFKDELDIKNFKLNMDYAKSNVK